MKKATGYLVYSGPSTLNGKPIVGILQTSKTDNEKIGDMHQLWIIPESQAYLSAVKSGEDSAVCGDCKHRPSIGGSCYVGFFAPQSVYHAYRRGAYPLWDGMPLGNPLRFGAWGDPLALPQSIIEKLLSACSNGWTGYSHQWQRHDLQWGRSYFMASVDNDAEKKLANAMGWRTFRVKRPGDRKLTDEIICPASDERRKTDCATCRLCCGMARNGRNVVIDVHGIAAKVKRFTQA